MAQKTIPGKMVTQHGIEVHTDADGGLHVKAGEQKLDVSAERAETLFNLLANVVTWDEPD